MESPNPFLFVVLPDLVSFFIEFDHQARCSDDHVHRTVAVAFLEVAKDTPRRELSADHGSPVFRPSRTAGGFRVLLTERAGIKRRFVKVDVIP
jgi:hypothetical protein